MEEAKMLSGINQGQSGEIDGDRWRSIEIDGDRTCVSILASSEPSSVRSMRTTSFDSVPTRTRWYSGRASQQTART